VAICPACGGRGSILPGELYTAADVPIFERVAALVKQARLDARSVRRLIAELGQVSTRAIAPELALLHALDVLPGLHFLLPAVCLDRPSGGFDETQLRRASGMLLIVISAQLRRIEAENAAHAS
jgi:hypothetical protein